MILNERQKVRTQGWLCAYEDNLERLRHNFDPTLEQWERDVSEADLVSMAAKLRGELEEYEALKSGRVSSHPLRSVSDVPRALIQARIKAGMSQEQLAHRIGVAKRRLQRYESRDYEGASLEQVGQIAAILGVRLQGTVQFQSSLL